MKKAENVPVAGVWVQCVFRGQIPIDGQTNIYVFFFINMGVRNSLRAPLLIPWALKLMTCKPLVALRGLELMMTIEE